MSDLCGTPKGYQRHLSMGTPACDPCLDEHRRKTWASRIRRRRIDRVQVPIGVLDVVLLSGDTKALREFLGAQVVEAIHERRRLERFEARNRRVA